MESTKLNYYTDSYQFDDSATLLAIFAKDTGMKVVILDHTIMYPQGGGQPYDTGEITQGDKRFIVEEVRFMDGLVHHIGHFVDQNFTVGATVKVHVDETRRRKHARLHTAGHLIDDALRELEYHLVPLKGYHFSDGPYVEYQGVLTGNLSFIAQEIEYKLGELVRANIEVKSEILDSPAILRDRGLKVPEYLPMNKPVRIITTLSQIPCGGTHVKYSGEIGHITITKIKVKGGNTRVCYQVSETGR